MTHLNVALLQMVGAGNDQEMNLKKGEAYCRKAAQFGADVALFPEMWNVGYTFDRARERENPLWPKDVWRSPGKWLDGEESPLIAERQSIRALHELAVERDGEFVKRFRDLARELSMAIAITYLERWDGAPRNTVSLIDRHGEIVLTYAKVHTCDFDLPEATLTPGDDFYVSDLDTAAGPVRVGAMICYDREFPESARILMLKGAELILTPNACALEMHRIGQFRARAYENGVAVAMANYARPQENGHSVAFDPVAFDWNGRSRDTTVVQAGEDEGVFLARFDLDLIRQYRAREIAGNAFRRPHRYGLLTSMEVEPPFVRVNERGEVYPRGRR